MGSGTEISEAITGRLRRNVLLGGAPQLISSGLVAVLPLAARFMMPVGEYALWSLLSTGATIALIFDLGVPQLAAKLAADGDLSRRAIVILGLLTATSTVAIGTLILLLWPAYSRASGLGGDAQGVKLLLAVVLSATLLKSIGSLYASAALGRLHHKKRTTILLGGAIFQVVVTSVLLLAGEGIVALAAGLVASGVWTFVLGMALVRPDRPGGIARDELAAVVRKFAASKSLASIGGIFVTQVDRWVVGLVAGATELAAYDFAIRLVSLLKVGILAFTTTLVAFSSRAWSRGQMAIVRQLFLRATAIVGVVAGVGAGPIVAASYWTLDLPEPGLAIILAMAVGAHSMNIVTAPGAAILNGMGRPQAEAHYIFWAALGCALGYGIGLYTHSLLLTVSVWSASLSVSSIVFVVLVRRSLARVERHASYAD